MGENDVKIDSYFDKGSLAKFIYIKRIATEVRVMLYYSNESFLLHIL